MLDRAAPTPGPEATPAPAAPATQQPAPERTAVLDLYPEPAPGTKDEQQPEPEPSPEAEEQPDPAAPAAAKTESETTDENTISTVKDLIEHFELDPEFFNTLKIDVKVDRETTQVPISDLIKSYQIGEAATKRLEDAKVKAAEITRDVATKQETLHASLSSAAKLIKQAEDVLEADVQKTDWDKLRAEDPAEYAARKEDLKDRRAAIKALKDEGAKAWRDAVASQQDGARANLEERIAAEKEALLKAIPEWSKPETAKADVAKLTSHLIDNEGFTKDEIAGTTDHRLLVIARKAMLYDALQGKTDAAKKKVAKIPKTLKPNTRAQAPAGGAKERTLLQDLYG